MLKALRREVKSLLRPAYLLLCIVGLLSLNSCSGLFSTKQKVAVSPILTPLRDASTTDLINEVNRLAAVKSIRGKLDIQFQDTSFATSGLAEKYRRVDATVTVQRPGKVFLVIQFLLADIAQMSSDGEHFRVAILKGDERYKRFVKGTKNANSTGEKDAGARVEHQTVSALSNLRPQHLTDAFLVRGIAQPAEAGHFYTQSELFEEETDTRPQAKKGGRVVRGYYLLEELSQTGTGDLKLKRRFWFDRVNGIRLARVQTFDDHGAMDTEVSYSAEKSIGEGQTVRLPSHIELTRRKDQYSISMSYQSPESVTIDKVWPDSFFVLENKWGLPEVDLDANNSGARNPR